MSVACPFARRSPDQQAEAGAKQQTQNQQEQTQVQAKQGAEGQETEQQAEGQSSQQTEKHQSAVDDDERKDREIASGRCPLGYDSGSFKLGPLSCVICHALLFDTCKCIPCGHLYCRFCVSRFNDCPLCGALIESLEPDTELQGKVDNFIEGHARVKRSLSVSHESEMKEGDLQKNVIYEDISLARGTFLVQQALRAFQAQNLESAKARLSICETDIKEELRRSGCTPEICSQLGAVLGLLGDCSRVMGDSECAIKYYVESVDLLEALPEKDAEVVHALSVSFNKIGDLKYYADDLQEARCCYVRGLELRKNALSDHTQLSSQVLDVAVSLTKVADVDRALGNDNSASEGFQEALKLLENLSTAKNDIDSLERRRFSILEFLKGQIKAGSEIA